MVNKKEAYIFMDETEKNILWTQWDWVQEQKLEQQWHERRNHTFFFGINWRFSEQKTFK